MVTKFTSQDENWLADIVVNSNFVSRLNGSMKITVKRKNSSGELFHSNKSFGYYEKPAGLISFLDELFNAADNWHPSKISNDNKMSFSLTGREKEVLREIVTASPVARIAKKLCISNKTVSAHKMSAMRKLGFRKSQELYLWLLCLKRL